MYYLWNESMYLGNAENWSIFNEGKLRNTLIKHTRHGKICKDTTVIFLTRGWFYLQMLGTQTFI